MQLQSLLLLIIGIVSCQASLEHQLKHSTNDDESVDTPITIEYSTQTGRIVHTEQSNEHASILRAIESCNEKIDVLLDIVMNIMEKDGKTILHEAAEKGLVKVIEQAAKRGGNINIEDKFGKTPLHYAVANDHLETVDLLIKYGANVAIAEKSGKTLLHLASESGNDRLIDLLAVSKATGNGINSNAKDNDGNTPIHLAATNDKNEKVIEKLLEHGADVNAIDKHERTALHISALNGIAIFEYCEGDLKPIELPNGSYFLFGLGTEKVARVLVKNDINVNATDDVGSTALHKVAENGNDKIAELLINAGIDKNFQDIYGYTAIHRSAQRGTSKVADLLVKSKADLNIRDNNGYTPYKRAIESDHRVRFEVVLVLNGKKVSGDLIEDHNQDSIEPDYRGNLNTNKTSISAIDQVDGNVRGQCQNGGIYESIDINYTCHCPIHYTGDHCQHYTPIEFSMQFKGNGYAELKRSALIENVIAPEIVLTFTFSTTASNGLIAWYGQRKDKSYYGQDFVALAIRNGFLQFALRLSGEETIVNNMKKLVNDGAPHTVTLSRSGNHGKLEVDGYSTYGETKETNMLLSFMDGNIFIGGTPDIATFTGNRYSQGFNGCIRRVIGMNNRVINIGAIAVEGYNAYSC